MLHCYPHFSYSLIMYTSFKQSPNSVPLTILFYDFQVLQIKKTKQGQPVAVNVGSTECSDQFEK